MQCRQLRPSGISRLPKQKLAAFSMLCKAGSQIGPNWKRPGAVTKLACRKAPGGSLLSSAPYQPTSRAIGVSQQLAWLTIQSEAQFAQDVRSKHCRAVVVEGEQGWIGDPRPFSQAIDGPSLAAKDFGQPTNDHAIKVASVTPVCQIIIIYEACFTYDRCRSKLARRRSGIHGLNLQWKTTTRNFCAGVWDLLVGFLGFAAGAQS